MLSQNQLKQQVAEAAVRHIIPELHQDTIIGVGTGSTVDRFIEALAPHRHAFKAAVSSSERSTEKMQALGIPVWDLNQVSRIACYIDGADEVDQQGMMIKGGGGALTREKIVASVADRFICIVDHSKVVSCLGSFPVPVEVVPLAREAVARQLRAMKGEPVWREGVVTDNGGHLLDVAGWHLSSRQAVALEQQLNQIPGIITCGIFAQQAAQLVLVASQQGVQQQENHHEL